MRYGGLLALIVILAGAHPALAATHGHTSAPVRHETTVPESATAPNDVAGPAAATPEAEQPEHAAETKGEGGLPQLNVKTYPSQAFWLLVMFGLLYTVYAKSILPGIGAVVDGRANMIRANLDGAEALRIEAEAVQKAYQQNIETAQRQAVEAVQEVELAAKQKAVDKIEAFRRRADLDIKTAESRMLDVRSGLMGDMAGIAADVARLAAEKITGISTDAQKARAIVDSIKDKAEAA